jgi:hypothetical protein
MGMGTYGESKGIERNRKKSKEIEEEHLNMVSLIDVGIF